LTEPVLARHLRLKLVPYFALCFQMLRDMSRCIAVRDWSAMFRAPALALVVAFLPSTDRAEFPAGCGTPVAMEDGWSVSEPRAQQLDPALICSIEAELEKLKDANPHSVVVVRNGVVVYEKYFTGPDQRWPQQHWGEPLENTPHDVSTKHDVQSITKSVVALLVGVAVDRGIIGNVDVPLLSFFPEYADLSSPERERITLRDLLTMQAGLDWPVKPYLSMARRVAAAPDPYRLVLEQPMVAEPGKKWRYNNGVAELVGGVVQKATGRPLDQFANDVLFEPLGITDWEWGRMASGDPGASWGLRLRPRDLAKIGQLILDHGSWHGRQIVSADWIKEMTLPRIVKPKFSYAYLWWRDQSSIDGRSIEWIGGSGWGGQCLNIIPKFALVVVVTAGVYDYEGKGPQNLACDTVMDTGVLRAVLDR
jgi:CubicO group peptidase (beta-lactamase class C family)